MDRHVFSKAMAMGKQGDSKGKAGGKYSPCFPLAIPLLYSCYSMACG